MEDCRTPCRPADAARCAATWLSPTLVAGITGALASGAVEAATMGPWLGGWAATGFYGLVAAPILVAIGATMRLLRIAWHPSDLALVEADGSAPRLAGWTAVLVVSSAALGWTMFEVTSLLSYVTEFKPTTVAIAEPAMAIAAAVVLVGTSRPLARGCIAIARWVDRRWRGSSNRAPLLTVRNIVVGTAAIVAAAGYGVWHFGLSPLIGSVDTTVFLPPAIGLAVVVGVHALWKRTPRARRVAGSAVAAISAIAIATSLFVWRARPSLTLSIWGECALAGVVIESLFDLDEIRARVPSVEFRPVKRPGVAQPDIILVTIDTVRADHTPPYGGAADMPALRDVASRGVVFDWAFAPSNVTRRSIPSMITGLGPDRIRGRVVGWALRLDPRHVVVAERLAAAGYDTAGFMCCEKFWGRSVRTGLERGLSHLEIEPNGFALAQRAQKWVSRHDASSPRRPLFLWMHILDPHNWTVGVGDPASRSERNKLYNRTLTTADAALGELLRAFSARAPDRAPVVIVTADHGESLGDHQQPYHSTDLYNSQIRVPLVIAGPGIKTGRIAQTVSLTDLMPSLLELAGFEPPTGPSVDGRSFADLATGKLDADPERGTAFAAMIRDRSNPGGISALIRGRWKLIESATGFELYDTRADPSERSNAIATHPHEFDQLRRELISRREITARSPFD